MEFPVIKADEKKELKTLYIDADEDHVSLQYLEHKGDIKTTHKYSYAKDNLRLLWTEVLNYLNEAYDMEAIDKIYINGDGATWIRTGEKIIPNTNEL